jgi:hypothetical protein
MPMVEKNKLWPQERDFCYTKKISDDNSVTKKIIDDNSVTKKITDDNSFIPKKHNS